jgi:hypothetical protein
MVGCWVMASLTWNVETNGKSKHVGSGQKAFFPEAEKRLYDWTIEVIEQRKQGLAVTYTILQGKMLNILKEVDMKELYGELAENFKTSYHWLRAFLKRSKLALR